MLKVLACALLVSGIAWGEAIYTVECEVHMDNGRSATPRLIAQANQPAEIKLGLPDRPDMRLLVTPRPASSSTIVLEGSVDIRGKDGWNSVSFKTENRLGQRIKFELGDSSVELRVEENK